MEGSQKAAHKPHRPKHSGPQADRKKKKKASGPEELQSAKQRNPRAFAVQSINKTARAFRRTADIKEKKHHIPVVDRTPLEPPPIVVAVVGPPKVGKTTLVRCMVKNFTQQNLSAINGPVTLVSGKKRRLTFIECNNDISSMIDVAKVADLVLLMVDASFGFEMETFEFLNIAQSHGFPKFMGVLTHLDGMKNNKALNKTKKRLKHRFWKEVYQGAKLFYLSGMLHGEYLRREIHNLGRFISVMKFRPLVWRTSHPYILADRMEDLTSPELIRQKEKCDRHVSLYGYVRGTPLKLGSSIHLAGCGDFDIKDITFLPDPCPLPDREKKRSLNTKERLIYAPMSGVGGIVYDKDVVYVELGNTKQKEPVEEEAKPSNELVSNLIGSQHTLDTKMATSRVTLFDGMAPMETAEIDDNDRGRHGEELVEVDGRKRRKVKFEDEDVEASSSEEEEDEDEGFEDVADDRPSGTERSETRLGPSSKKSRLDFTDLKFADSEDDLEFDAPEARTAVEKKSKCVSGMESGRKSKRIDTQEDVEESEEDLDGESDDEESEIEESGDSSDDVADIQGRPKGQKVESKKLLKSTGKRTGAEESESGSDEESANDDRESDDGDESDGTGDDVTDFQGRPRRQKVKLEQKRQRSYRADLKGSSDKGDSSSGNDSSSRDDGKQEGRKDGRKVQVDKKTKTVKSERKRNNDDSDDSSGGSSNDDIESEGNDVGSNKTGQFSSGKIDGKPKRQKMQVLSKKGKSVKDMGKKDNDVSEESDVSSDESSDSPSNVQGKPNRQKVQPPKKQNINGKGKRKQKHVSNEDSEENSSDSSSDDDGNDTESDGTDDAPGKQKVRTDKNSVKSVRTTKKQTDVNNEDKQVKAHVSKPEAKGKKKSQLTAGKQVLGSTDFVDKKLKWDTSAAAEKSSGKSGRREKVIEEEEFEDPSSSEEESGDGEEAEMEEGEMDVDQGSDQEMGEPDEGSDEDGELRWKESLTEKAAAAFIRQQQNTPNLRRLVYGEVAEDSDDDKEELGGLLTVSRPSDDQLSRGKDGLDSSSFPVKHIRDWDLEEVRELIKDCFVTGNWEADEDAETLLQKDDEMYGDFEDLETGEVHKGKTEAQDDESSNDEDDGDKLVGNNEEVKEETALSTQEQDKLERERRMEKKRKAKMGLLEDEEEGPSFFEEWKEETNQQAQLNRAEFEDMDDLVRTQYEGFRPGMYVRVEVANVPYEFVANFDPTCPMVLGGLLSSENAIGFVQIRLKKHRWYPKILKTRDPLIFSVGWRRFQTMPLYCIQDHNGRNRLLKYTPQHLHCIATIWGPITPQGTGILAVQSLGRDPGFRIAATGVILDLDKSINIVKKLKLTGVPFKIHKNTAFIQGMFNSPLEVAKFEGALIRTVSGIRGQIKKSYKAPPGAFRASFEDKILRSDIVFLRTWYQVQLPKLYNPVTNLLLPKEGRWTGMRTVGQLRKDNNVPIPVNQDSLYKPIVRQQRKFAKMVIPRKLAEELPFKYRPQRLQKKGLTLAGTRAVIREPHERKIAALMQELGALYNNKKRKEREVKAKKSLENKKRLKAAEEKLQSRQKRDKREMFRLLGQMKKNKRK